MKKGENIYINRELSWLDFNSRVLEEAEDETLPLLERLKFVSIFGTNLDEFLMVRFGSLYDQSLFHPNARDNKSSMTPQGQMNAICRALPALLKRKDAVYNRIISLLEAEGVSKVDFDKISPSDEKLLKKYFTDKVLPFLSPQIVDERQTFPFLRNKGTYVALQLKNKSGAARYALVAAGGNHIDRVHFLYAKDKTFFALSEELIYHFADIIFPRFVFVNKYMFSVTRNADIDADEAYFDQDLDWREIMQELLNRRRRLAPVRLQVNKKLSKRLSKYLRSNLKLKKRQIFTEKSPFDITFAFTLASKLEKSHPHLLNKPIDGVYPVNVDHDVPIITQAEDHDILLSFPFHKTRPFVRLLEEAAQDSEVSDIKITLYRVATNSLILSALLKAAENGKNVTAMMELRARFDEQNNIDWSKQLESAGVNVIYGLEEFKVHSKLLLITKKKGGNAEYITQIGTGNYNEKTAELYTDLSLISAKKEIGEAAQDVFCHLQLGQTVEKSDVFMVSPHCLMPKILAFIDREIQKGENGYICIKCNSVTDKVIIDKLLDASKAGVKIKMFVRGICCFKAGVASISENITVKSIVGRYLEHSRIYVFGKGEDADVYISSADFMTRNTIRRVEVAAPVLDKYCKQTILKMLEILDRDNVKARIMRPDGTYERYENGKEKLDSQMYFFDMFANEEKRKFNYPEKIKPKIISSSEAASLLSDLKDLGETVDADAEKPDPHAQTDEQYYDEEEENFSAPVISKGAAEALAESLADLNSDEETKNNAEKDGAEAEVKAPRPDEITEEKEETKTQEKKKGNFFWRILKKIILL